MHRHTYRQKTHKYKNKDFKKRYGGFRKVLDYEDFHEDVSNFVKRLERTGLIPFYSSTFGHVKMQELVTILKPETWSSALNFLCFDGGLLASRTVRRKFLFFIHCLVCGIILQQKEQLLILWPLFPISSCDGARQYRGSFIFILGEAILGLREFYLPDGESHGKLLDSILGIQGQDVPANLS